MSVRSVLSSLNNGIADLNNLSSYRSGSSLLEPKYQFLVNEVLMLRIFSILEFSFAEVAYRLSCGASYLNANSPSLFYKCKNIQDAHSKMLSLGRRNPKRFLKWTTEKDIKDNIRYIIDPNDPYISYLKIHSSLIEEMRVVRNHISHKTNSTRQEYKNLIRTKYGANAKLAVGVFLTSVKRNPIPMIDTYLSSSHIILKNITSG